MPKLSDPDYFLPVIEASEAGSVLDKGRTRPMIVRGVCRQTGIKSEYVVKLKGSDQMWEGATLNEVLGAFIAMELGFWVPEPVIVNLSLEFVNTMTRHDNFNIARVSLGFNFGNELHAGLQELVIGQPIGADLRVKLLDLFALDVFLGNPDRRINKPNFLTNGKDLLIYDHELAFSFVQILSFLRNPEPWLILPADIEWLKDNFCYQAFKGNNYDFSNFAHRLSVINEDFWRKAVEVIPRDWQLEHLESIKEYLSRIALHAMEFAGELNRVIA